MTPQRGRCRAHVTLVACVALDLEKFRHDMPTANSVVDGGPLLLAPTRRR